MKVFDKIDAWKASLSPQAQLLFDQILGTILYIMIGWLFVIVAGLIHGLMIYPRNTPSLPYLALSVIWALGITAFSVAGYKHLVKEEAKPNLPFRERLETRLRLEMVERNFWFPPEHIFKVILSVGEALYTYPRVKPERIRGERPEPTPDNAYTVQRWDETFKAWENADTIVFESIVETMMAYIEHLPPFIPAPFTKLIEPTPRLIWEITEIHRDRDLNIFEEVRKTYNANVGAISEYGKPPKQPQLYNGPIEQMAQTYLRGTPYLPLFQVSVPYQPFSELNRCAHHWCLGPTRRGKTTFLRHLIRHDLNEVADEKCSLIVMDSKDKGLINEMRYLKRFAAGQPLDGRLILIDSDKPFPLNPFAMKDKGFARNIITYMLSEGMTELQAGALGFYVDSVLQSREKNLHTLLSYIRLPAKQRPKQKFDDELDTWWDSTRDRVHDATISGLEQRIANFMRENRGAPILKNLQAHSWGLDLYGELHEGGKVLLVDTDFLQNGAVGASLMGRLIIALIDHAASRRQRAPKPIWCYIDEATDYLKKTEPRFEQILIKAAGAKVGMAVAYQGRGMIDPKVERVLETNAEIQSLCEQRGTVQLVVERRPMTLAVKQYEFTTDEPQMEKEEYSAFRRKHYEAHPYNAAPEKKAKTFDPNLDAE